MIMKDIRKKANVLGIKPRKMKKIELVRTIQKNEGNPDCYGKSGGYCPRTDCCFFGDCLKVRT